ncbi:MAG: hypothetical protein HYY93_09480 [Planctomycetes bacterium]|nr:hypothetical protein [Planctomycetota bacterium]
MSASGVSEGRGEGEVFFVGAGIGLCVQPNPNAEIPGTVVDSSVKWHVGTGVRKQPVAARFAGVKDQEMRRLQDLARSVIGMRVDAAQQFLVTNLPLKLRSAAKGLTQELTTFKGAQFD